LLTLLCEALRPGLSGLILMLVNLMLLVSSCSVLDSTFASTSKLFGPELLGAILRGRPLPPQLATVK
jgi:hypothetical protein